jgi:hypothetical protein
LKFKEVLILARDFEIYMAAPPGSTSDAVKSGFYVADMIYRVGNGFRLYCAHGVRRPRGGVMALDTSRLTGGGPLRALTAEVSAECEKHGYRGIVLDTGGVNTRLQALLAQGLCDDLRDVTLYVPETLASSCDDASILIQTALSGGTLRRHLESAVRDYGASRVALEIERVRMDFVLPERSGVGTVLTDKQFKSLYAAHCKRSFYSPGLCANYFTYRDGGRTHIVLFDDAASIRRKLELATGLGIGSAFLFYPHVSDLLSEL